VDKELAIVTGAGSGIGRACALALGSAASRSRRSIWMRKARRDAAQIPGARAYRADVSVSAQVDAAVSAAVADLGPIECW
jgi:NAD(P)-dependent dehydrogenase (short-subunit alcohol dehydrogenase family)